MTQEDGAPERVGCDLPNEVETGRTVNPVIVCVVVRFQPTGGRLAYAIVMQTLAERRSFESGSRSVGAAPTLGRGGASSATRWPQTTRSGPTLKRAPQSRAETTCRIEVKFGKKFSETCKC